MLERTGPLHWGTTFAEATDLSPWEGMNVDEGYGPNESILMSFRSTIYLLPYNAPEVMTPRDFDEQQLRSPEHMIEQLKIARKVGSAILFFTPDAAKIWKERWGFDTVQDLQDYFWDNVTRTRGDWVNWYWSYGRVPKALRNERGTRTLNPDHYDLPDDALVPCLWSPEHIKIVVAGGDGAGWGSAGVQFSSVPIDEWR